jgi:hypothetical protein
MSCIIATTSTSESLIKLRTLQLPTHRREWVDWAERWLRTCDKRSLPRLNTCSMSTEVAMQNGQNIRLQLDSTIAKQHTRNAKIIECHSRQTRVHGTMLKPPKQDIGDLLSISTEIAIDLLMKLWGLHWGGKNGIKHVHVLRKGSRQSRWLAQISKSVRNI